MTEPTPDVTIVIPVFRAHAETLAELCGRLTQVMHAFGRSHEILLVDDSGDDPSWPVIEQLALAHPQVRGLRLGRNYGQHNALLAGIRAARGGIVVTMDDDLQNPPEEIPKLLAALTPSLDVVYGVAAIRRHSIWHNIGAAVLKAILARAMGSRIAAFVSPFRAFRRDLRLGFAEYRGKDVMLDVLLNWSTSRFDGVAVEHQARRQGRSSYSPIKLLRLAMIMVVGFSALPLRLASLLGFATAFFGLVLLAYILVVYAFSSSHVPGFTFLTSIVIIFSGGLLSTLGIIGEYLAQIHFRMMGRPAYLVREETSHPASARSLHAASLDA